MFNDDDPPAPPALNQLVGEPEQSPAPLSSQLADADEEEVAAQHHNDFGIAAFDKDDYDSAMRNFNKAIELRPQNAVFYNNRGTVHYRKKDFTAAIQDYNEALKLDPEFVLCYVERSKAHYANNALDSALRDIQKAAELDKMYIRPRDILQAEWDEMQKQATATAAQPAPSPSAPPDDTKEQAAQKTMTKNEKDALFFYEQGMASFKNVKYSSALEELGEAIGLDPQNAMFYHARAQVYKSSRFDPAYPNALNAALEDAKKAASLDKKYVPFRDELQAEMNREQREMNAYQKLKAEANYESGMDSLERSTAADDLYLRSALISFDAAIRGDPQNARYYYGRAKAHDANKDPAAALKDARKAAELDEKYKIFLERLQRK